MMLVKIRSYRLPKHRKYLPAATIIMHYMGTDIHGSDEVTCGDAALSERHCKLEQSRSAEGPRNGGIGS